MRESVEVPSNPIAPVTTATSPTATPAPKRASSTLDAEDSQLRQIPPLDDPGGVAGQVLTIDQSIISQLPPNYVTPPKTTEPSPIVSPASEQMVFCTPRSRLRKIRYSYTVAISRSRAAEPNICRFTRW